MIRLARLSRLLALADRLEHQAELKQNSGLNEAGIKEAGDMEQEARDIHWIIKEHDQLSAQIAHFRKGMESE